MSFGVLALVVLAGLAGPLVGSVAGRAVPVVVGELAAGVLVGNSGLHWLDPTQPTLVFMASVGFAMLMFEAGMHVPIRQPGILSGARRAVAAAIIVTALAIPAGIGLASATSSGHAAVYALLLASGSAAILLPTLDEAGLLGDASAMTVLAQVGIADVAAIVALPLVLQPGKALSAALGGLAVAASAAVVLLAARLVRRRNVVGRFRRASKKRGWALDLRLALLVLFTLCWLATRTGTSILIAGFAVGLVVAAIGGPKRLTRQVTGVAAGFFVPLFFVVLGARLGIRAVFAHPTYLAIAALLVAANVVVHLAAAATTRQPLPAGLAATAQLGLPAAVATVGLQKQLLSPGLAGAILLAALATIAICPLGVHLLLRRPPPVPAASEPGIA